jgi:hypothetical protein
MVAAQRTRAPFRAQPGILYEFAGEHRAPRPGHGHLHSVGIEMKPAAKLDLGKLHQAAPTEL